MDGRILLIKAVLDFDESWWAKGGKMVYSTEDRKWLKIMNEVYRCTTGEDPNMGLINNRAPALKELLEQIESEDLCPTKTKP